MAGHTVRVRLLLLTSLAGLLLVPSGLAHGDRASPTDRATLRLASTAPLKLRGSGFVARERIRVVVSSGGDRKTQRLRADAAGRFVVAFAEVTVGRCDGLSAEALGSRGSRAAVRLPHPVCPPRL